ncbi:potassium channel family protein [Sediminicola luteus]|uniref:Potassium channel domain-containing protein n=1 Tax=Sediminicola luteus TaxID=319238 RepID=A0A2A4G7G5_9FLAO|nr:potassium channel family protein [Sediminicola luteus]PCE63920.1 hypothetical protein B7P33_11715 [Sediminicola luteus]
MPRTLWKSAKDWLYEHRFINFFITQVILLFGPLFFPGAVYANIISPIFLWLNLLAGMVLIAKLKKTIIFFAALLLLTIFLVGSPFDRDAEIGRWGNYVMMATYFSFFAVVTLNLIKQVWDAKWVDRRVIFGSISGFISLGLMGFFLCTSIYMDDNGAFRGLSEGEIGWEARLDELLYYSYVTLLTIGYGDIVPVSPVARKASFLLGMVGQFYNVIIMAVVLEKYIRQGNKRKKN